MPQYTHTHHKTKLLSELDCNEPFNFGVSVLLMPLDSEIMNECSDTYLHTLWFHEHFQQELYCCHQLPFSYILQASSCLYFTHSLQNTLLTNTDCLYQSQHKERQMTQSPIPSYLCSVK
jgi:hypothetical protein